MNLQVNRSHKKAKGINKSSALKNVLLVVSGVVIGISLYSGCTKLKSNYTKEVEKISNTVTDENKDQPVNVEYNKEENNYVVKYEDKKWVVPSLIALFAGVTTGVIALKNKKKASEDIDSHIYNFDITSTLNDDLKRKRRGR